MMVDIRQNDRKPWLALALSLAAPGLGHVYCGRPLKGIFFLCTSPFLAPLWIAATHMAPATAVLVFLLVLTVGLLAVYGYAIVDAFLLARREGRGYSLRKYNWAGVYLLFLALGWVVPGGISELVKDGGFQAFYIPAASMRPNLLPGDYVLANKRVLTGRQPRPGEVVVFRDPETPGQLLVKRVIAGPGERVVVRDGRVYINGSMLEYDNNGLAGKPDTASVEIQQERRGAISYPIQPGAGRRLDQVEIVVPAAAYFLMGDNRANSRDSRQFGPVRGEDIIGAVHYLYMPGDFSWDRWGVFKGSRL
jgi:signal peptidase I